MIITDGEKGWRFTILGAPGAGATTLVRAAAELDETVPEPIEWDTAGGWWFDTEGGYEPTIEAWRSAR